MSDNSGEEPKRMAHGQRSVIAKIAKQQCESDAPIMQSKNARKSDCTGAQRAPHLLLGMKVFVFSR
jgi:hypothetical protein